MKSGTSERGISLIEVIVALVVISGFGASLFVWAGQTLQTATRAGLALTESELDRNISEFALSINPAERPEGRLEVAQHAYEWTSSVLREPSDHVRHPIGLSPYQVGLYKVKVRVVRLEGRLLLCTGERTVAGFKQVRVRPSGPPGFNSTSSIRP